MHSRHLRAKTYTHQCTDQNKHTIVIILTLALVLNMIMMIIFSSISTTPATFSQLTS